MIPVTQQVMRQTKARIFKNDPHAPNKLVSLFETATQIIRKGKSAKPTEFGRLVKIPESENQIITHHEVCDGRPADSSLLLTEIHRSSQQQFGHAPRLIAADAAFNWTKDRRSGPQNGGQTVSHSASFHQEYRVASIAKEKMVPTSTSLANRIGRSDQCGQTPTRIESLSISRRCRHETMGWIGCDRGQPDQYRKNFGASGDKVRGKTRERDERLEKSKATRTVLKRRCSCQFTTPIFAAKSS